MIDNNKLETLFNKLSLIGISIIGALIGVILILISNKFPNYESTLIMIGQTIISISFSSLLLEWIGYVNYTRKRMSEILLEDKVIKILDVKRKKELKSALIKDIYMPNKTLDDNNIATLIDDEMDKVLKGYYYEEYISYIDSYYIDGKNNEKYIKKDIKITFTAKSVKGDKCIIETLLNSYINPPSDNNYPPIKLKKLLVDGKDITEDAKDGITSHSNDDELMDIYPNYYNLGKKNGKIKKYLTFKDRIDVDMEYSTIVDEDDLVYSYQIDKACQHFCIHFNTKENEFDLMIEGFGFMSLGNNSRQRIVKTNNGYMLRFLNWILPGDGAIVVLKPKKQSPTYKSSN